MTMAAADLRAVSGGDDGRVSPRADRPRRRQFTAEYKARVLAEYDAAEHGAKGAILRREGLYSSHLVEWRRARDGAVADALGVKPRGRSAAEVDNERLRRDNERLASELAKKDAALDVVGKVHALLEQLSESADAEPRSKP